MAKIKQLPKKKSDHIKDWARKTNTGRIVYHRKKHFFTIKRLVTIAEELTLRLKPEDYYREVYACHALFEVARNTYEPFWLDTLRPTIEEETIRIYWQKVEPVLREAWRKETRNICDEIGKAFKIPQSVRNFVLKHMFDTIWNVIWKLTDPLFRGRGRS